MKQRMIQLPVVEIQATDDPWLAKHYPKSDRYIIVRDNGDVSVADVQLRPIEQGEARLSDERLQGFYETFIGQPALLDPDEYRPKADFAMLEQNYKAELRDAKQAHEAEKQRYLKLIEEERQEHDEQMTVQKQTALDMVQAAKDAAAQTIREMEQTVSDRKKDLEHEYELRRQQLEAEVPKRFAQGEWVSGKTLTEIVRTLTATQPIYGYSNTPGLSTLGGSTKV